MRRNKIIDISFLLRTVVLTAMLCLSFHIGAFSHIAPDHSIHFVPARNLLISTFLFVLVAQTSVNSLVLQVWNKITPVKSKSTLIETEIVYILSVLLGIPLFAAIFLHTTISDLPILLSVLFFAALPGSFCAYIFLRINMKTLLSPQVQNESGDDESPNDCGFDPTSLNIIAYLVASTIFAFTLAVSVCFIIFLRLGPQLDKLIPIITSIFIACGSTALLLTVFGHVILPVGVKIKTKLNMVPGETRTAIASTWLLGFMTITTLLVVIFGGLRPPTSINSLIESWHLWVTYVLFGISSYLGGLTLKSFYKPKPTSAVFA